MELDDLRQSLRPPRVPKVDVDEAVEAWNTLADAMVDTVRRFRRIELILISALVGFAAMVVLMAVMVASVRAQATALIETQAKREAAYAARRAASQRVVDVSVIEALEKDAARSALENVQQLSNPPPPEVVQQLKQAVEATP